MDIQILNWINQNLHGSNFINYFFKFVTFLGEGISIWALVAVVLLCIKKTRKTGLCLLLGLAVVALSGWILKVIVDRPRPFVENPELAVFIKSIGLDFPKSGSFPSGHTIVSFGAAIILTLCFKKYGAWSYLLATLIAFSRLFLCVHYPTDVLAGAILGSILGAVSYIIFNFCYKKIMLHFSNKKSHTTDDKPTNTPPETDEL